MTSGTSGERPYHHGDLRAALLVSAATEIAERGVAAASLRRISARAGVSHTAAAHHFGDKRGLLSALAADGHRELARRMAESGDDLLAMGRAYVAFAVERPAHFEVMFQPDVLDLDDPALVAARAESFGPLVADAARNDTATATAPYAAWSFAHGVAALARTGNLPASLGSPVEAFTALARGTRFS